MHKVVSNNNNGWFFTISSTEMVGPYATRELAVWAVWEYIALGIMEQPTIQR